MSNTEERIIKVTFDNSDFESKVAKTIKTLHNLDRALDIKSSAKMDNFSTLSRSCKETTTAVDKMSESVKAVEAKFSSLQVVGMTVMSELTKAAMSFGKKIYDNTLGQIVSGGTNRSANIENAKFQLKGLGVAWDEIQDSINYSVSGTAYGLDSAAKVAAQLVASGVDFKESLDDSGSGITQMHKSLRAISGVAAMTNSSYDEIGHIFTTVAGNGRLMTMQLQQLSNRGLNVAAALAEQFGKTEEEIRSMVSAGKIGFADFANAMDNAYGEHSKEANSTFDGALSNMKAALSKIGVKFIDPFRELERTVFNDIRNVINIISNQLDRIVPLWDTMTKLAGKFSHTLLTNKEFLGGIQAIVIDVYTWIRTIAQALLDMGIYIPTIDGFAESFHDILDSLQLWGDKAEKAREIFRDLFSIIDIGLTLVRAILIVLEPIFGAIVAGLGEMFGIVGDTSDVLFNLRPILKDIILLGAEKIANEVIPALIKVFKFLTLVIKVVVVLVGLVIAGAVKMGTIIKSWAQSAVNNIGVVQNAIVNFIGVIVSMYNAVRDFIVGIFNPGAIKKSVDTATGVVENNTPGPAPAPPTRSAPASNGNEPDISGKHAANPADYERTAKAVSTAAKSMERYSEATRKAANGGNSLKDNLEDIGDDVRDVANDFRDAGEDLVDAARRSQGELEDIADLAEDSSNRTAEALEGVVDGIDSITDESLKAADRRSASLFDWIANLGTGASNGILNLVKKIQDAITGSASEDQIASPFTKIKNVILKIVEGFLLGINAGIEFIVDRIENPFKIIGDFFVVGAIALGAIIIKAVGSILSILAIIPSLVGALGNITAPAKYQGIALMFGQLTQVILALTAFVIVLTVASNYMDIDAITKFMDALSMLGRLLLEILLIKSFAEAFIGLIPLLEMLFTWRTGITKVVQGATVVNNAALVGILQSLALLIIAIVASIALLRNYDPTEIFIAVGEILAILTIIYGFIFLVDKFILNMGTSHVTKGDIFKGIQTNIVNNVAGVATLLITMIPLIFAILGAVSILNKMGDDFWGGFAKLGAILFAIEIFVITVVAMVGAFSSNVTVAGSLAAGLSALAGLLVSMSISLGIMAGVIFILSKFSEEDFEAGFDKLVKVSLLLLVVTGLLGLVFGFLSKGVTTMFLSISAVIISLTIAASVFVSLSKSIARFNESHSGLPEAIDHMKTILADLVVKFGALIIAMELVGVLLSFGNMSINKTIASFAAVILSIGASMLMIVNALKIIQTIDPSTMIFGLEAMKAILIGMASFIALLTVISGIFGSGISVTGPILVAFGGVTAFIFALTLSLQYLSDIPVYILEKAKNTILDIVKWVGGIIVGIMILAFLLNVYSNTTTTVTKTITKTATSSAKMIIGFIGIVAGIAVLVFGIQILLDTIGSINWDNAKNSMMVLTTAFVGLAALLAIVSIVTAKMTDLGMLPQMLLTIITLTGVLLAIGGLFKLMEGINFLSGLGNFALLALTMGSLIGILWVLDTVFTLVEFGQIMGLVGVLVALTSLLHYIAIIYNVMDNVNFADAWIKFGLLTSTLIVLFGALYVLDSAALVDFATIYGLIGVLGALTLILGGIALIYKMLDGIDLIGAVASFALLTVTSIELGTMLGVLVALTTVFPTEKLPVLLTLAGGMTAVVLSMAILFAVMKGIDPTNALTGVVLLAAVMSSLLGTMVLIVALGALAEVALPGLGIFTAIVVEIIAIVGTLTIAAVALSIATNIFAIGLDALIDCVVKMADIPVGPALLSALAMSVIFTTLSIGLFTILPMIPALLAVSVALPLLATGISMMSVMDPEKIFDAANALAYLFTALTDFEQSITGGLMAVFNLILLSIQLDIGAGLLLFALANLSLCVGLMTFVNENLPEQILLFAETLASFTTVVMDPTFSESIMNLLTFTLTLISASTLLTVGGAIFVVGAVLLLVGSGIFQLACAVMFNAMSDFMLYWEAIDFNSLSDNATNLIVFAAKMTLAGTLMIMAGGSLTIGSALFAAGVAIFRPAARNFERAIDDIADAVERGCEAIVTAIDTARYAIESISGISGDYYDAAINVVAGFTQGIDDNESEAVDSLANMAELALAAFCGTLGIHSPATEMIEAAWNCVKGFCQGIGDHLSEARDSMVEFADTITDEAGNIDLGAAATEIMNNFLSTIQNVLSGAGLGDFMENILHGAGLQGGWSMGAGTTEGLSNYYKSITGKLAAKLGEITPAIAFYENLLKSGTQLGSAQLAIYEQLKMEAATLGGQLQAYRTISDTSYISSDYDPSSSVSGGSNLTLTPTGGGGGAGGASASGIDPSSVANNVGNTITTNNTYNFTQNNYSPEPIDRTELYTQTNNQLNSWYKWLRTQ